MKSFFKSTKFKIFSIIFSILFFVTAFNSYFNYTNERDAVNVELQVKTKQLVKLLKNQVLITLYNFDYQGTKKTIDSFLNKEYFEKIQILLENGEIFADTSLNEIKEKKILDIKNIDKTYKNKDISVSPIITENKEQIGFIVVLKSHRLYEKMIENTKKDMIFTFFITLLGTFLASLIVSHFVTKPLEEAIKNERIANRAKSDFLATMSHEIRTPMNAVLGMSDLLNDTQLTKEQQAYLKTIQSSGNALLDLINEILDYSKIEANELKLETLEFDLEKMLNDIVYLLQNKVDEKHLRLIIDYGANCPKFIKGDSGRLRQILINLIGNAIKFTHEGHILIRIYQKDEYISFDVEDTGIGISKEQQANLFQAFTQADSSTTRKYGGTGLGLAISQRLAKLFQGNIAISSQLGKGSTFTLSIPLESTDKLEPIDNANLDGVSVLIVDDYEANRVVFKRQLEAFGMRVQTANNAFEALKLLRENKTSNDPFELVLTDQNMPEMDGLELIKRIINDPQISPVVIAASSSGQRTNEGLFEEAGASGYMLKPIERNVLKQFLQGVLGSKNNPNAPFITRDLMNERFTAKKTTDIQFKGRVLVAEDTAANVIVIRSLLKKLGVDVVIAKNGKEALEEYIKDKFNLIFMDIRMPVMDGFESTHAIREHEQQNGLKHIPIVALTADVVPQTKEKTFNAGMDSFVKKPFKRDDIIQTLSIYLTSNDEF